VEGFMERCSWQSGFSVIQNHRRQEIEARRKRLPPLTSVLMQSQGAQWPIHRNGVDPQGRSSMEPDSHAASLIYAYRCWQEKWDHDHLNRLSTNENLKTPSHRSLQPVEQVDTATQEDRVLAFHQSLPKRHKAEFEQITADPHHVLYMNSSINDHFTCGRSLASTTAALANGKITVEDLPLIRVVRRQGKLVTLDHRRLYVFRAVLPRGSMIPMKLLLSEGIAEISFPLACRFRHTVRVESLGTPSMRQTMSSPVLTSA